MPLKQHQKKNKFTDLFGIDLINLIKQEHPGWFDAEFEKVVVKLCEEAFESEREVVEWIFEKRRN
jgi:ribonucleoside-diphosphate reductase beta chain